MVTQGVDAWPLKVSIALLALGLLLIIFAATSVTVFRFHRVNFLVSLLLVSGILVLEWLLVRASEGKANSLALAHTSSISGALLLLLAGLALLVPSTSSSIAKHFHPFVLSSRKRKPVSPVASKTGRREVHTLFEDWPDPVPFPVTALYAFQTNSQSELAFTKGQPLVVLDCRGNWWQAKDPATNITGFIPSNFVQVLQKAKVIKRHLAASDDEATVQEGQLVEVMEHHEFLSLVRTVEGRIGSIPTSCLELIPDVTLEKLKA